MSDSAGDDGSAVGGDIDRLEISLRVTGDDLEPERITRMLGVAPTFAARKGESVDRGGVPVTQRTGVWIYRLPASPEWELGDAIDTLLEQLPPDPALWESIASRHTVDLFCGLFLHGANRGARLGPETLARLADRRLSLGLDIYGPSTE